jgi:hypothetical protein
MLKLKLKFTFLVIVIVVVNLLSSLNVFAASWDSSFYIPGDNQWHYTQNTRVKENDSYVYFKLTDVSGLFGRNFSVAVDSGYGWENIHTMDTVDFLNVGTFLTNYVFENHGRTNIRLAFKSPVDIYGVWSPDSVWEPYGVYIPY